jgi:hypothetical protein
VNLNEAQALIMLFQACRDSEMRRRALRLVPELLTWDEVKILNDGQSTTWPCDVTVHEADGTVRHLHGPRKKID